jgi:hypothetical protein
VKWAPSLVTRLIRRLYHVMPHYCPQCDAEVGEHAEKCPRCPALFKWPGTFRPIYRNGPPARDVMWRAAVVLTPFLAFLGTFAVLCVYECTALPWFTFYVGPVVALVCTIGVRRLARRAKARRELR